MMAGNGSNNAGEEEPLNLTRQEVEADLRALAEKTLRDIMSAEEHTPAQAVLLQAVIDAYTKGHHTGYERGLAEGRAGRRQAPKQ